MLVTVSITKYKNNFKETIKQINETTADYIHIDLMDGKFVPQKQLMPADLKKFLEVAKKPLDVHLMAENPHKFLDFFASYRTEYITFHLEAVKDPQVMIDVIHSYGLKCGISIKPTTNIKDIIPYLNKIEQVLIMSVEPGLGGQSFMPEITNKINELALLKQDNLVIGVDGGINEETIHLVKNADMVVSGSYICLSDNFQERIDILKG